MPGDPESYVHRIGRTARAGSSGAAISFCDADEVGDLRAIERTTRQTIDVDTTHGFHAVHIATRSARQGGGGDAPRSPRSNNGGDRNNRGGRNSRGGKGGGRPWENRSRAA
jgi:ATP-dependent RNA helicase RhlE